MNVLTVKTWPQHYACMTEDQLRTEITLKSVRRTQLREANGMTKPDGWRIYAGHLVKLFKDEFAQYIMDTLHVTRNTAKAHIAHVYTKLGVHSHQELLSLVETAR